MSVLARREQPSMQRTSLGLLEGRLIFIFVFLIIFISFYLKSRGRKRSLSPPSAVAVSK